MTTDLAGGWLFKSEPDTFSWADLIASPHSTTRWDGVRNYQARNFLRDELKKGSEVFFYHSSCAHPAIVGLARVVSAPYPDPSQFDPASPYFDDKSITSQPRWWSVDVKAHKPFKQALLRQRILQQPSLAHLELCRRGSRLSVQPIDAKAWNMLLRMAEAGHSTSHG